MERERNGALRLAHAIEEGFEFVGTTALFTALTRNRLALGGVIAFVEQDSPNRR